MARVFDCFPFFNELDLLEIRLHELADVVDYFVLAEATTTFSGRQKPLLFSENRGRFASFLDRIIHVIVEDMPAHANSPRVRERHQRDALMRGLGNAASDDLIILSDIDELPKGAVVRNAAGKPPSRFEIQCLELRMYNYFVNLESEERWLRSGPRIVQRRFMPPLSRLRLVKGPIAIPLRNSVRALRGSWQIRRPLRRKVIPDAGWHFTYLGGIDAIQRKVQSYAGHETVSEEILDPVRLEARIRAGLSVDTRRNTRLTYRPLDSSFPRYLVDNQERFAHLILQP